jgi:hypothetical protein
MVRSVAMQQQRRTVCWFLFLLFVCLGQISGFAQDRLEPSSARDADNPRLSAPHKRVVFGNGPFSVGSSLPYWDKDFLVSRGADGSPSGQPIVRLYDDHGKVARETSIWLPGAVEVGLISWAATDDGKIIASGVAIKEDGTRAYFVATTNADGVVQKLIQTNPFHPRHICALSDGSVWSFGGVYSADPLERDSAFLLRQFDFSRGLVRSLLPRSSFKTPDPPAYQKGDDRVYLRCSQDRLVIYSEVANEFISMNLHTGTVHRLPIDRSGVRGLLNGIALTDAGDVFGLFSYFPLTGMFHLEPDENNAKVQWRPVALDRSLVGASATWLLGSRGKDLIYMVDSDDGLLWSVPNIPGSVKHSLE